MTLTADQILGASDSRTETVSVPEWGGDVKVRTLTGRERDSFEASIVSGKAVNMVNVRAKLVARTLCDDAGKRLFTDAQIEILGDRSARALDRVFAVAQRINGLSQQDVDELAKNSGSGQSDASTTG